MVNEKGRNRKPGGEAAGENTSLGLYLKEIGQVRLLSREEEEKLAKRVAQGDPDARKKLIESNLRLVVSVARKYSGRGLDLEDLIQEGNNGLMCAADKFDWSMGFRFSTYATGWIEHEIKRAISNQCRTIRVPEQMQKRIRDIDACSLRLREQGKEADDKELARQLNLTEKMVKAARAVPEDPLSLNALMGEEKDSTLENLVSDPQTLAIEAQIMNAQRAAAVEKALRDLPDRQADVLRCAFGLNGRSMSLEEIGKTYGMTKEGARQSMKRALARMRHPAWGYLREFCES